MENIKLKVEELRKMGLDGVNIQFDKWCYTQLSGCVSNIINSFILDFQDSEDVEMIIFDYKKAVEVRDFILKYRVFLIDCFWDSYINKNEDVILNEFSEKKVKLNFKDVLDKAIYNVDNRVNRYGGYVVLETNIDY